MVYRLPRLAIQAAIRHICRYGDTDVFPHLPELAFVKENEEEIVKELEELVLENYDPGSAIEALGPKSRYGFRILHQMSYIDNVILLASVIDIAEMIESCRSLSNNNIAFTYKFELDQNGKLFSTNRGYGDWLEYNLKFIQDNLKIKTIIETDISDFYARINFHRLENLLDDVAPSHGAVKYIKKHIKVIRAKQSFGLPVGGSAARILAELALSDTDKTLDREGHLFTRFVDDYRIFLKNNEDPYDVLAFLAQMIGINEGLSLNASKTKVYDRHDYIEKLNNITSDVSSEAQNEAILHIISNIYSDEEPSIDDIEKLKNANILEMLKVEISSSNYDVHRIKVLFSALRVTKPVEAIEYLSENFSEMLIFAKDVVLLMQVLEHSNRRCFDDFAGDVVKEILSPPASCIQLIRTWLLELFVRGVINIDSKLIKKLETLSSVMDKRQLYIIRGRIDDKNFFRSKKTAFDQHGPMEQSCLIMGAGCLPEDEYKNWLQSIKNKFNFPTSGIFLKWIEKNRKTINMKLSSIIEEHQE